jgi:hypothetical protein
MKPKAAIASVFATITANPYSHNSGMIYILSDLLENHGVEHEIIESKDKTDWNEFEHIYLWQGLDMNGKLGFNLFGGACESNLDRLRPLSTFEGSLTPLLYRMQDYRVLRDKKGWPAGTFNWAGFQDRVSRYIDRDPMTIFGGSGAWTIGDSHAPSVWEAWNQIRVLSGRTLHGVLDEGLELVVPRDAKKATLYFGNIDLRHHLCRRDQPFHAVAQLAKDYVKQAKELEIPVELCALHPIEDESRAIPTPGWYKGSPFFGTWEQRDQLRQEFNDLLERLCRREGLQFLKYPEEWVGRDGKMDQEFMERPRSVHIAPKYYRCNR